MVINDVFDIEIDKTNNPSRPLVTGQITKKEAIVFLAFCLFLSEFLSMKYLPLRLQYMMHASIINVISYTKVLKPIFLIKNVSCAGLVALALYFCGFASTTQYNKQKLELLQVASRLLFYGSLHNEILLDICDYDGDKMNNIYTLPVICGIPISWYIVYVFTSLNLFYSLLSLQCFYNSYAGVVLFFSNSPLLYFLLLMKRFHYSKEYALLAVKRSSISLFLTLIYLCGLATWQR
jgi:geranylgeranylglycerol-phosphate geranylgeranyltransferase